MANGIPLTIGNRPSILGAFASGRQFRRQQEDRKAQEENQARLQGLLGQIQDVQQPVQQLGQAPQQLPGEQPALGRAQGLPTQQLGSSPGASQALSQLAVQFPEQAKQIADAQKAQFANQTEREKQRFTSIAKSAARIQGLPADQQIRILEQDRARMQAQGITDLSDTDEALELLRAGRVDEANAAIDQAVQFGESVGILQETAAAKQERKTAAGLDEVSEVQSSKILPGGLVQFVRKDGTVETVPASEADEALIQAAEVRGAELQGLRAGERGAGKEAIKQGAKAFEDSVKIRKNVANLNEGIRLIDEGAGTGRVESLLPSVKKASVELDNLQKRLGLDIIGSVTFGALSEGELNLALSTALPTGLDEPELREWLVKKRDAQMKMLSEVEDAALFLSDPKNDLADFIVERKNVGAPQSGGTQVGRFIVEAE